MKNTLNDLLFRLEAIYEKSEIRKECEIENREWGYSLVTTAMAPASPLILGFNWGASKGEKYVSQKTVEETDFTKMDIGSLKRIFPFVRKHLGNDYLSKVSQSNYCFFRSQKEEQISSFDIDLCRDVFSELIQALDPSSIICFSSRLRDHLLGSKAVIEEKALPIKFIRGTKEIQFVARRGRLASGIDIKFLPHPNYPMTREARELSWQFCCE